MARVSLDTSRLPHDVLTYADQRFFDFIERFCGKDEADLLSIQAIRSVDSFLAIQNVYSIFALDSEDVIEIQTRCGFKNRNGTFTVKPGIKSSLDHVTSLLKQMKKEISKKKKNYLVSTPSTISISSSNSINSFSGDTTIAPFVLKKNEVEHYEYITTSIEQWCIQNKSAFDFRNFNFICGIDYHLKFNSSLDKADIVCSCGLPSSLFLAESGNFKISNYFRHLKTTCSIVRHKSINNSTDHEQIRDNTVISRDSSSFSSSQQPSTNSIRKRARQTTAVNVNKKKIRTT